MRSARPGLRPREGAVLRAFAEALVPGNGALPAVEDGAAGGAYGVSVVDPASRLLAAVPRRARIMFRVALALLEVSTFPRRFSRLARPRRTAHLERLERSGGTRRDVFFLVKALASIGYMRDPRVKAVVGADARCTVSGRGNGAQPGMQSPSRLDPAAMETSEDVEHCDVVVVGSGAGGAAAARVLAEGGLSVIVVEEGEYFDASSYPKDSVAALTTLYRDGGFTVCEGRPVIPVPVGRCVGGTTVVNSGTCLRPPDDVLRQWRDEFGIPWATELDREFESIERDLRVKPVNPATAGRNAELCRIGAEALGASNGPIPRNAGDVTCCGTCPTGCTLDAKQAMHVSELPRAVAAGCRLRAAMRVEHVVTEHGRAAGVMCRSGRHGGRYEVRARAVLLAAGALGTPELLLAQGMGNSSGELGRNLHIHPACWVGARYEEEVRGWEGVMQSWYVDEWKDRGLFLEATFTPVAFGTHWLPGVGDVFKERIEHYDQLGAIGVHLSDHSRGRVALRHGRLRMTYRLTGRDAAAIRFGIARAAEIHFAAGAREVFTHLGSLPPVAAGQARRIEQGSVRPRDLRLEGFHPMGTARMGKDPSGCVVAPTGDVHGTPGLYVADASIFPTSLRVNPMITIMACARWIAASLANRLA